MRLLVTTPTAIVVDAANVRHVRAEDATGAFGIEPRHTDLLTALVVSVMSYRDDDGVERHVAVRGGVLRVRGGQSVEVATREAMAGDDLEALRVAVLDRYRAGEEAEATARSRSAQLHLLALRGVQRYVRGERDEKVLPLGRVEEEEATR